ncbi:MAG: ATP-binding cassette domain-containing protein [Candidatus Riflebacteria bacterium]|nr:ATP-binding cassette domain-containing protein [Candidatus Riflebacteria bacterium]
MKPAIEVVNISKKYFLNGKKGSYDTIRDAFLSLFVSESKGSEFWALKDISFDVMPGECLGIIGKNGVGKTTLLRILSKITPPSYGHAIVRGSISSLLEVGTGFHPELSGFDNIFLNGSILGLTFTEIHNRLDEIIDFAEIGDFINTPMKFFSTGMWARLAFSVAAHLNSEILLIDEVLSVGDSEFQEKSRGKMRSLSSDGRTILFVSHNMAAVRKFCNRSLLLDNGVIQKIGETSEVIQDYVTSFMSNESGFSDFPENTSENENSMVKLKRIELRNNKYEISSNFFIQEELNIHLYLKARKKTGKVKVIVEILEADGNILATIYDSDSDFGIKEINNDCHVSLTIADLRFYPGKYFIRVELLSEIFNYRFEQYDLMKDPLPFNIINNKVFDRAISRSSGLLFLTPKWKIYDS